MNLELIHEKLLELMITFDEICKTNHIYYTLYGGSMLGAVREHGFIPWDDDIDIAMTREEFKKLQWVLEGNEKYRIYGDIKKQFKKNGNSSLWIDIFVCDYIGKGTSKKMKIFALTALDIMSRDKNSVKLSNLSNYGKGKQAAFKIIYVIGKIIPRSIIVKLYSDISENRWQGDKNGIHMSNDQYKIRKEVFPCEWMKKYQRIPFENQHFLVIEDYHEMLVRCYGENYMIPIRDERDRNVHNIVRSLEDEGTVL